jgi:primosomal protein N' (replication factor Y)
MSLYVAVSVNIAHIDRVFHYHVPEPLQAHVQPGTLVVVPFGPQTVQGVVLSFVDVPEVAETLPVESVLDEQPVLTPLQMALAKWMAQATLAPLSACVAQMIPAGLSQHADILVRRGTVTPDVMSELPELQRNILNLLQKRGDLRGNQLEAAYRQVSWRPSLYAMKNKGLVHTSSILPAPRVGAKIIRTAQLAIPLEQVEQIASETDQTRASNVRRMEILRLLAKEPLPVSFSWIYAQTGASYTDLKKLVEQEYILFNETEIWRDPLEEISLSPDTPPVLTPDQQAVWEHIHQVMQHVGQGEPIKPVLLHGVTGSGKTEIYMQAVAETLASGRQAIVLVPEIALTPQTVRRFMARFPNRVGIYHSKLSPGERYDTWRRARKGDLGVIVGARSALFMPLPNIGLVVLDECDQDSYDQNDILPYYHGVEVAEALARLAGAVLILGSATPRITQYYQAQQGKWDLQTLPQRVLAHKETIQAEAKRLHVELPIDDDQEGLISLPLPRVSVVDMRQELVKGNRSVFSLELQQALYSTLEAGQQAILFLNRKGTSTYVFCRECGYVVKCPRDDKPLIYYVSRRQLLCHTCGYTRQLPTKCPNCNGTQIRQLGTGTEKLADLVTELLPGARVLRWDADTTSKKGAHDLILSHFSAHRADILIGTQMLAKGLDLPLVTLVGIILAEVGLNLPDYRAAERTFQVLTQVAGRAGRSPLGGRVIMQTYTPENYAIQAASRQDYASFYAQELKLRQELAYPPFTRLVKMEYRNADNERAEVTAQQMAENLRTWIKEGGLTQTDFIGPVPCFYTRLNGQYRWQIVLRGPDPAQLLRGRMFRDWLIEVDPPDLL